MSLIPCSVLNEVCWISSYKSLSWFSGGKLGGSLNNRAELALSFVVLAFLVKRSKRPVNQMCIVW